MISTRKFKEEAEKLVNWFICADIPNKDDALETRIEESLQKAYDQGLEDAANLFKCPFNEGTRCNCNERLITIMNKIIELGTLE